MGGWLTYFLFFFNKNVVAIILRKFIDEFPLVKSHSIPQKHPLNDMHFPFFLNITEYKMYTNYANIVLCTYMQ